jgi:beta-glucanase (GH16 family)
MPDHVCWYLDGQLVNSYHDIAHIPRHPMTLKTNYAINDYYNYDGETWTESDKMIIDHIKVCQLKWDCGTDETITCQSDLDVFDYAVKKTVSITSTINEPIVSSTAKITFRVADSFEITGPFEVQSGGEFTVILQDCPN